MPCNCNRKVILKIEGQIISVWAWFLGKGDCAMKMSNCLCLDVSLDSFISFASLESHVNSLDSLDSFDSLERFF